MLDTHPVVSMHASGKDRNKTEEKEATVVLAIFLILKQYVPNQI